MALITSEVRTNRRESSTIYLDDGSTTSAAHEESDTIYTDQYINEDIYNVDVMFDISKSVEDKMLVSGWANVAVNANGSIPLDWQGDVIAPEELEKAAIGFMLDYGESGEMHKGDSKGTVVESIVFTKDKQESLGIPEGTVPEGWFITVKVKDNDVFQKVKEGKYKMFSIQGTSKRIEI